MDLSIDRVCGTAIERRQSFRLLPLDDAFVEGSSVFLQPEIEELVGFFPECDRVLMRRLVVEFHQLVAGAVHFIKAPGELAGFAISAGRE